MVTKGIIKSIDFNGNSCIVRMPYFETAGSSEVVCEALISNAPGVYNGYKENDVVWVAFENGTMEAPVVIGKLYLGAAREKQDPRGTINCVDSTISGTATIPSDTKLKNDLDSSQINTKIPYRSLESLANNLNRVDTEQGQNNRDLGNRLRTVVDGIGPDGGKIYSLIEQTATDIRNEVVHKSSKTEPGYNDTKKMGWELNLNGWDVYSEYENLIALENNITLSVQKSLTKDINTIFINNTDTEITPQEMCGYVILEFIKKPGWCEISPGKGGTGKWTDETDPGNPIVYYSYESRAEKKDPDTEATIAEAEYKCLEMSKFLKTFLGQANAKYLDGLTYDDSKSVGNVTRTSEQLQYREYYINYDSSEDINQGWCVFFDTSEIGHELTFKIVYYEEKNTPSTAIKPITVKVKAMLLFKDENEASIDLNNRYWSLVSYYNINSSTQTRFAPVNFLRTHISDKTNTLVGINRNGLYVNGTVAAKNGSIGEFIIGGTHSCEDLNKDIASGIYSKNYIKRFEDQPTKGQTGVYVGTDGIKIGDKFSVSADGKVRGSGFEITLDDAAQKDLQIVNKNYQDGNTKLDDVYANKTSGDSVSLLTSADKQSSTTHNHTVSYSLDTVNKVSAETMEYSLLCPNKDKYSLLAMPLLLKNSGTLFASEENYIPWTISFKVKKADGENHSAGIPTKDSPKKLFVFLGTLEKPDETSTDLQFDTLPASYYIYKNLSSCNIYTKAMTDETGITAETNVPTIDAATKKFSAKLSYDDWENKITYGDIGQAGYGKYVTSYPKSTSINVWGYYKDSSNKTVWGLIPINKYLSDRGYAFDSTKDDPQTVGASRYFSSCNFEYESYYCAYLLAEITQDSNLVHEAEDPDYSVVSITLDRRYYNLYNSLKDRLRLGICYFDPTTTEDNKVPLLVKEFKFEKSKIYSDYTLSDYDSHAVTSNSKTIAINNIDLGTYNSYVQGKYGTFTDTAVQRSTYHIIKNDIVIVQGTLREQKQDSMYTICFREENNSGDLGGIIQFKYKTSATAEISTNTKYKYYATTNNVSPSDASGQPTNKDDWSDSFIEPNGDKPYIWGSSVMTVSKNGQVDAITWSTPVLIATYDGLLTILSAENVNLVEVDKNTTPHTYYLRGDVITGALGNKVKIGGDAGFTINPSTETTSAAIYNTIDHFDSEADDPAKPYGQGGVYLGTDGIRLGNNFFVDKLGNVTANTLKTIVSTETKYAIGISGTSHDDIQEADWKSTIDATTNTKPFLWSRTQTLYTTGESEYTYAVSSNVSVTNTTVSYQNSADGTKPPSDGTWTDTANPEHGKFTWTRTTVTYSDGHTSVSYSVSYTGNNGQDGQNGASVEIKSTEIKYINSENGIYHPPYAWENWSASPSPEKGKYLWSWTKIKYTNTSISDTDLYSVSYMGSDADVSKITDDYILEQLGIPKKATENVGLYYGKDTGTNKSTLYVNADYLTAKKLKVTNSSKDTLLDAGVSKSNSVIIGGFTVGTNMLEAGTSGTDKYVKLGTEGISLGKNFSVDNTGAITSTRGTIGNLTVTNKGLSYTGSSLANFNIGEESSDSRMPTYAIFARTQRIDDCIMGFKNTSYGENFWVEFKPDGYCTYKSSDNENAIMTGKIPYNYLDRICWLHTPLGGTYPGNDATCTQIIVLNITVDKGTYKTLDLSNFGIHEIIGAQLTERDTANTGSNNQWFSVNGKNITVQNTTTKQKTYSLLVIAI